ncbi:MAG TPA: AGE family epimerase/isomerase [Caulobacteraceae bacterium]
MIGGQASPADRLARLAGAARDELYRIIPFWLGLRDPEGGGFAGEADSHGRPLWSADKGAVLQTRILWFFSKAYLEFADPRLLDAAWQAYRFIAAHLVDPDDDGVFWTVSALGAPADTRKHLYAQAFAIYALAAFYQASGEPGALGLAQQLWSTVERHAADPDHPGYFESFSADWHAQPNGLMGRAEAPKSFNAHFHLLEAYGALWQVWPDPDLRRRLEMLIALLTGPMLDRRWNTFRQVFEADGRPLDDGGSFGHDIEASWLIPAIADRLSPATAAAAGAAVSGVAEAVLDRALEPGGGVVAGFDSIGGLGHGKIWWVQAEALVGFLDAFERRGDRRFLDAAERVWGFIDRSLIDQADGEWRWRIDPGGETPTMPKAHLWKCPYHNGRALMEVLERAKRWSD